MLLLLAGLKALKLAIPCFPNGMIGVFIIAFCAVSWTFPQMAFPMELVLTAANMINRTIPIPMTLMNNLEKFTPAQLMLISKSPKTDMVGSSQTWLAAMLLMMAIHTVHILTAKLINAGAINTIPIFSKEKYFA